MSIRCGGMWLIETVLGCGHGVKLDSHIHVQFVALLRMGNILNWMI